jgi:hypothetical protein
MGRLAHCFLLSLSRYQHGAALAAKKVLRSGPAEWQEEYADWDFPPKPKWMRWETYNRLDEKAHAYGQAADDKFLLRADWQLCQGGSCLIIPPVRFVLVRMFY